MREIQTVSGSCKIDMRFMLRNKYIVRNTETMGVMQWTQGQSVNFECKIGKFEKYLRLMYSMGKRDYDYKIFIVELLSNLGKGTVLYFRCPESGKRSRVLFSAYGEPRFLNREYYITKYGLRLWYGSQKTSKRDYHNTRYFDLERKVNHLADELNQKHRNTHYRGQLTKDQRRLSDLILKMEHHDRKRIEIFTEAPKNQ